MSASSVAYHRIGRIARTKQGHYPLATTHAAPAATALRNEAGTMPSAPGVVWAQWESVSCIHQLMPRSRSRSSSCIRTLRSPCPLPSSGSICRARRWNSPASVVARVASGCPRHAVPARRAPALPGDSRPSARAFVKAYLILRWNVPITVVVWRVIDLRDPVPKERCCPAHVVHRWPLPGHDRGPAPVPR